MTTNKQNDRDILIEMLTKGARVYTDAQGFTIQHEAENDVVYPMYNVFASIFANPNLTGNEVKLYFYLKSLEHTQYKGAFPSHKTIMEHHKMTKKTLIATLDSMEKKNMIFILNRKWYDSEKQTSNLYFFNDYNKLTGVFYEDGLNDLKQQFPNKKALVYMCIDKSSHTNEMILLAE